MFDGFERVSQLGHREYKVCLIVVIRQPKHTTPRLSGVAKLNPPTIERDILLVYTRLGFLVQGLFSNTEKHSRVISIRERLTDSFSWKPKIFIVVNTQDECFSLYVKLSSRFNNNLLPLSNKYTNYTRSRNINNNIIRKWVQVS